MNDKERDKIEKFNNWFKRAIQCDVLSKSKNTCRVSVEKANTQMTTLIEKAAKDSSQESK